MAKLVYIQCKLNLMKQPLFLAMVPDNQPTKFGKLTVQHQQNKQSQFILWTPEDPAPRPRPGFVWLLWSDEYKANVWWEDKYFWAGHMGASEKLDFRLDNLMNGFYAFNNHDGSRVMDIKGDVAKPDTPVIPFAWNSGDNQMWQYVNREPDVPGRKRAKAKGSLVG